jgi:hypothetical protein
MSPRIYSGAIFLYGTTDAGILRLRSGQAPAGMTTNALSPRPLCRGLFFFSKMNFSTRKIYLLKVTSKKYFYGRFNYIIRER